MMGMKAGRRGMKSPPLLIAVLLACVCVLGIHYWITSTRCMELQSRVMDLESRMRRAAAERGAVEMKKNEFEDMLAKQKKQIDNIQSMHSSQMQNIHLICNSEKENLLNNMTTKDNLIQELQVQIVSLQKRLEDSKLELKALQESQAKKSAYELTQCSNKIAEVNEQCEEKIRRLLAKDIIDDKDKSITKFDKLKPTVPKEDNKLKKDDVKEDQYNGSVLPGPPKPSVNTQKQSDHLPDKEDKVDQKKPSPSTAPKQGVNDDNEQDTQNQVTAVNAADDDDEPKAEDTVDKDANKETENEEVERENLINMDDQKEDGNGMKEMAREETENQNDYNGDEANEAEPEADKQAQLIDNDQNLKEEKISNGLEGQPLDQEAEDSEDPPVK